MKKQIQATVLGIVLLGTSVTSYAFQNLYGDGLLYALGTAVEPVNKDLGLQLKNSAIATLVLTRQQEADIIAITTGKKTFQLWEEFKKEYKRNPVED